MDTTLILIGVACIIGAIIGGGVKLVQVELGQVSSLWRQSMLGVFGVILVGSGLLAGGHIGFPESGRAAATQTGEASAAHRDVAEPAQTTAGTANQTPASTTSSTPDARTREPGPQPTAIAANAPALPSKVDIFWCETDAEGGAVHRDRAERIAPALRATGTIGRVRVRALAATTNARSDYGIDADIVRFDPGERAAADAIARLASAAAGSDFAAAPALPGRPSIDYLSVFVCGAD